MTVSAKTGTFGFGPQTAKGSVAATFYRHKATDIDFSAVEDQQMFPDEIGGVLIATGAFKAGAWVAGGATLFPRMAGALGWLLYAAMGSASSVPAYGGEAGVYGHVFVPNPDNDSVLPWLTAYKDIPGGAGVARLYEQGLDCKVAGLEIGLPAAGLVSARPTLVGRVPSWAQDQDLSGHDAAEDYHSVPISCVGQAQIGGADLVATEATVTLANQLTTPQQERIIGSYYPDDLAALARRFIVEVMYKWDNPDLYQQIRTGAASGTTWSPIPHEAAVRIEARSPRNITGQNQPWRFTFSAPAVSWQADPVALAAGRMVVMRLTGVVMETAGGAPYAELSIVNDQASYIWPT